MRRSFISASSPIFERRNPGELMIGRRSIIRVLIGATLAPAISGGSARAQGAEYRLGPGDKLRIVVFGEADLSGEFVVDGSGSISLPLIGAVAAGGQPISYLESQIVARLKDGYIKNPRVSIDVLNYRPFFILGEVNHPGGYPFISGMTVLNAIAIGGGYTYRARKDRIIVIRASDPERKEAQVTEDTPVFPGDIIRVAERYF